MMISNAVQMLNYQLKHLIKSKNNENAVSRKVWYHPSSRESSTSSLRFSEAFCDMVLALSVIDISESTANCA